MYFILSSNIHSSILHQLYTCAQQTHISGTVRHFIPKRKNLIIDIISSFKQVTCTCYSIHSTYIRCQMVVPQVNIRANIPNAYGIFCADRHFEASNIFVEVYYQNSNIPCTCIKVIGLIYLLSYHCPCLLESACTITPLF